MNQHDTANDHRARGAAAAAILSPDFPTLAEFIGTGIPVDCQHLLATKGPELHAVLQITERALNHQSAQIDHQSAQIDLLNNRAANLTDQLSAKTTLCDRLTDSLLNKASQKNTTARRQTRDPERFNGEEKDVAKRQAEYATWRSQAARCLDVDRAVFEQEYNRIQYIAGLLSGQAYELHREDFDAITSNRANTELWRWKTAEQVLKTLNTEYETLDLSRQAAQDFDNLFMTNSPFPNFISQFENLAIKCKKTNEQKVDALRLKVSVELTDGLAAQIIRPGRSNYEEWKELYSKIWENAEDKKHMDKLRNPRTGGRRTFQLEQRQPATFPPPGTTTPPSAGDPMELDATRRGPRMSIEEARAKNLCLYCKKPGHYKRDCEEKKKADMRFPRQGYQARSNEPVPPARSTAWVHQTPTPLQPQAPYQPQPLTPYNPAFQRLRYMDTGHVVGDDSSTASSNNSPTPSDSVSAQGNEGKA